MSTADHTAADSPAPRGDAAGRMTIPLAILPAPVPPALIRSRPPHPSIPQTKPQRTALLEAIRRGLHERPAVPPLRHRAWKVMETKGKGRHGNGAQPVR